MSKLFGRPETKQLWCKQDAVYLVMAPLASDKYVRDNVEKWAGVIKQ